MERKTTGAILLILGLLGLVVVYSMRPPSGFGEAYYKRVVFSSTGFSSQEEQRAIFGPSLLGGMEVTFGTDDQMGVTVGVGGSYNIADIEWWDKNRRRIHLALDIGLLWRF